MKAILKLFLLLVLFLVSPISFAQSDPCSDLIKIFHTCIEDDVLVCTNTDHRCTAQWAQSCIMSYEEYEAKLMACRRQNPPQMTGALPELSSGRAESYFETKGNGVSWFYGGVEEYIPGFWDAVGTVLSDIQSEPNSLFSPKRISALQEEDMHKNLSNVKQSLEKEITEEKVKNKVFQSDFEQLQKDQKALTDPLDQALAKVEENMDLKFAQFLENEKAELGKLNIPEETQSSRTAEDILKTGLPETIEKVQKEKTNFEKELQLLFDDKNYIELNQKIYETQLELSTLNAISPLPHALEIYAQAKREVISQYIDEQGLIHFTSDSHRFPQPKLYSDPNSLTGIELRYHMSKGMIAWETQKDEERTLIESSLKFYDRVDKVLGQENKPSLPIEVERLLKTSRNSPEGSVLRNQLGEISNLRQRIAPDQTSIGASLDFAQQSILIADQMFSERLEHLGHYFSNIAAGLISFSKAALDIGVSLAPIIGDGRDFYELTCGKDLFSGEEIGLEGRTLSALGLLIGSGAMYRKVGDTVKSLIKGTDSVGAEAIETALKKTSELPESFRFSGRKRLSDVLRDANVPRYDRIRLIRSFEFGDIRSTVLDSDMIVYRWHNNDTMAARIGKFFTPDKILDPQRARKILDLPDRNKTKFLSSYKIPAGTEIFEGNVSLRGIDIGGGKQIYVSGSTDGIQYLGDILHQ